jgi:hypothetical protein
MFNYLYILGWVLLCSCSPHQNQKPDDILLDELINPLSSENIFETEGYYNWGGSIIKGEDGLYHLFYSRWKSEYEFTGWLVYSEVAHATAESPTGPWEYHSTALQGRGKGHWDATTAHNPKIKYFEGRYYLYYISTNMGDHEYTEDEMRETAVVGYSHPNWKILRPNQRTGVAVSSSLNGPWERFPTTLIEPSGPITTLTVNPAIARGADSRYYLIVKGDKPNEERFIRNQAIAISTNPDGPFEMQAYPVIDYMDTEDMSIWYDTSRKRFYGIFHSTEGFIGLVTSADGLSWEKARGYQGIPKKIPVLDGTTLAPLRLERPFIYQENNELKVLCLAAKEEDTSFTIFVPLSTKN